MEKEKKEATQKLSYEQLNQALSELHMQYQKLTQEYRKALDALNNRDFEYTSFFLSILFKVIEHPEMYQDEFVKWAVQNVQAAIQSFAEIMDWSVEENAQATQEEHNK